MKFNFFVFRLLLAPALTLTLSTNWTSANDWSVPLAGNTFRSQPGPGGNSIGRNAGLNLGDADEIYSTYFHADRAATIQLAIKGHANNPTEIVATVAGKKLTAKLLGVTDHVYPLGSIEISEPGYVRVDLQLVKTDRPAKLDELIVMSDTAGLAIDFVKNNEGNMFYWGRRGPSVHLSYRLPENKNFTYAYSEITVPKGQDAIGSYFMANGFGEGYFGIQVNSASERRVLFSVWSPFQTDNPRDIPSEDRIVTVAKGEGVVSKDFGNEGSGGQSFWIYPWQAGVTYRFLTKVQPDGAGNTLYTSWFGEKQKNEWHLIASFRRPKTDKHLTGFHSFLENFSPDHGHVQRSAHYGNQWVGNVDSVWQEITQAKFTGDATARGRHRLDYAGGAEGAHFDLQNCGFFEQPVPLNKSFNRKPNAGERPDFKFEDLPRK